MKDVGEKDFVQALISKLSTPKGLLSGFGHDASIIELPNCEFDLALKIDRASQPVINRYSTHSFETWGAMAVTSNISDILAVGAVPNAFAISLTLPGSFLASDAEDIVHGAKAVCDELGVVFSGGDTKEGMVAQVVGSATGLVSKGKFWPRRGGNVGDRIYLAGSFGDFLAACRLIENGQDIGIEQEVRRMLTRPRPRISEAAFIRQNALVTSCTDLSDGLFEGLSNLCSSACGIELDYSKIPFGPLTREASRRLNVDSSFFLPSVGDWCIVFATSTDLDEKLRFEDAVSLSLHCIGSITSTPGVIVKRGDNLYEMKEFRNEHFVSTLELGSGLYSSNSGADFLIKRT